MEKFPLVSVAVITYNQKNYLRACLDSIMAQDYPNMEIVVADDGSTDGTQTMLKEYDKKYPEKFILCLSKKNQGITANSNNAHFACSGKYVAWIGGDDLMLPGKISKQVDFLERHPSCAICYHDLDVFDDATGETLYFWSKKIPSREGSIATLVRYGSVNGASSTMVRRCHAPSSGYNIMLPVASDWLYWVECLNPNGEIRYINEILGRYRRHDKNVTKKIGKMRQVAIDHFNSCCYLLSIRPDLLNDIMYCFSLNIRGNRHCLPYVSSLVLRLKFSFDIKCIFALITYVATFGRLRL